MMKKIILAVILAALLSVSTAFAAGTCLVTYDDSVPMSSVTFTCTGDASDGTFPDTTTKVIRGWIIIAETNPGSTGPTDNYDIVLNTSSGVDVMGGALANRDVSNTERATPSTSGWVNSTLTQVVSNASVNSATFTNTIWYWRQE